MCKLRDDTMSQAGELPLENNMNQKDKDAMAQQQREVAQLADFNYGHQESSAAVRGQPSDLTEREQIDLLCQVETYMAITDKFSQTTPAAVAEENRMYGLVNGLIAKRFSDIGAAVRGEAVAWAVTAQRGGIHKLSITKESADRKAARWQEEWPDNGCAVRPLVFGDVAPVSARAADALDSQPTGLPPLPESDWTLAGSANNRDAYTADQMREYGRLCVTHPTVAAQQGSIGEDLEFLDLLAVYDKTMREKFGYTRALNNLLEYIDSRAPAAPVAPLAPDGCDECRHTYCLNGETCRRCGDVNGTQGYKGGKRPQQEGSEAGNG